MKLVRLMMSVALAGGLGWAGTVHVDDSNDTGTENGTQGNPYATIQAAINPAQSGDTVKVAQGTYPEDLSITGKHLTIQGGYLAAPTTRRPATSPTRR